MRTRLARLAADVAALPVADSRTPEDMVSLQPVGVTSRALAPVPQRVENERSDPGNRADHIFGYAEEGLPR